MTRILVFLGMGLAASLTFRAICFLSGPCALFIIVFFDNLFRRQIFLNIGTYDRLSILHLDHLPSLGLAFDARRVQQLGMSWIQDLVGLDHLG